MAKLHEILASSSALLKSASAANEAIIALFTKKPTTFLGSSKAIRYFSEEDKKLDTDESVALTTTVMARLKEIVGPNARALNIILQKELSNQDAKADIEIDGKTIASDVPVTALLSFEGKLAELRKVYEAIPTLGTGIDWEQDQARGQGIWRAKQHAENFRTRKTIRPIILHEATQHHPAQVSTINEDVPVAKITESHWSGMLTASQKATLLERIDQLLNAAKTARMRANNAIVPPRTIGNELFEFIHKDIVA